MALFNRKKKTNRDRLETEIDAVLEEMEYEDSDTDKYTRMSENLERLFRAKSYDANPKPDGNTILQVGGTAAVSLIGILLITKHEDLNVITSKALQFVTRKPL